MTDISHYTKNLGRVSIIEDEIADTVDSFCMLEEMNIHKKKKNIYPGSLPPISIGQNVKNRHEYNYFYIQGL